MISLDVYRQWFGKPITEVEDCRIRDDLWWLAERFAFGVVVLIQAFFVTWWITGG